MSFIKEAELKEFKFYNIEEDPLQKNDISEQKPMLFDSLRNKSQKLFQEIISEGSYWKDLPGYNPKRTRLKQNFMRNPEARWDME